MPRSDSSDVILTDCCSNDEMKSDEAEAKPPTRSASVVEAMPSEEFTNGNKSEQSDTFHTQVKDFFTMDYHIHVFIS